MPEKDLLEAYLEFYELTSGPMPNRDQFKQLIADTVSADDLAVFFLLPDSGAISEPDLLGIASEQGIQPRRLLASLDHLFREALICKYMDEPGTRYERSFLGYMMENQVRMRKGTPLGARFADAWVARADDTSRVLPTKTPIFRVLPVESSVTGTGSHVTIQVNKVVPDPRQVLPFEVVSKLIKKQKTIAVAECYCRLSRDMTGEPCTKPHETCMSFNEHAQSFILLGTARQIDYDEAMRILVDAEKHGLVHNVSNCEENIWTLCNCCACCCPSLASVRRGLTNINGPSRFVVAHDSTECTECQACVEICPVGACTAGVDGPVYDTERCIGCGLCASACEQGAVHLVLRENPPWVARTNEEGQARRREEALAARSKAGQGSN